MKVEYQTKGPLVGYCTVDESKSVLYRTFRVNDHLYLDRVIKLEHKHSLDSTTSSFGTKGYRDLNANLM